MQPLASCCGRFSVTIKGWFVEIIPAKRRANLDTATVDPAGTACRAISSPNQRLARSRARNPRLGTPMRFSWRGPICERPKGSSIVAPVNPDADQFPLGSIGNLDLIRADGADFIPIAQ